MHHFCLNVETIIKLGMVIYGRRELATELAHIYIYIYI